MVSFCHPKEQKQAPCPAALSPLSRASGVVLQVDEMAAHAGIAGATADADLTAAVDEMEQRRVRPPTRELCIAPAASLASATPANTTFAIAQKQGAHGIGAAACYGPDAGVGAS